jgi:predicted nucleotidyltransferase
LREDFDEKSDVDVLVTFAPEARVSISTLVRMESELKALIGRDVDVVERRAVEANANWIRRKSILNSAQLVYAAA